MTTDETVEGYFDGIRSDLHELPEGSNRSESYKHGWRNGRDDRLARPRATAAELRQRAADIALRERFFL